MVFATVLHGSVFGMRPIGEREPRCRELFPLPVPSLAASDFSTDGPSSKRKQIGRQREVDAVEALNDLICGTGLAIDANAHMGIGSSDATARVTGRVREFASAFDGDAASKAAVSQLLGAPLAYDGSEAEPQSMGSYNRDMVALPTAKEAPMMLSAMLDRHASQFIAGFESLILRSTSEMESLVSEEEPPPAYWDPRLKSSRKRYLEFVELLADHGIIGFTQRPAQQVGCFFVKKKDGRLRLIVDARRTNRRCKPPPSMQVGGTGSWSHLRIPQDSELFMAQYDVEAYFYRLGIGPELGRYFSLQEVPAWLAFKFSVPRDSVPEGGAWHPYFRVVPMGWSWAMYFAQRVHVQAHILAGFPAAAIVVDGQPPPSFKEHAALAMPYCDNGNIMALNREDCASAVNKVMAVLRGWKLGLQDILEPTLQAESLGVHVDGRRGRGEVRPSWSRLSRIVAACEVLSRRPKISSKQLERLVGHITYVSLLHRPLLSLLNSVYAFIRREFVRPTRVWKSVARELWYVRCLLPLARSSLVLPSHPIVFATDASTVGMSVVATDVAVPIVDHVSLWNERYRFGRCAGEVSGRARALLETDTVIKKALKSLAQDFREERCRDHQHIIPVEGFQEVSGELIKSKWHQLFQCKWGVEEKIHVLEARGCVAAVRHLVRSMSFRHTNVVILNDNLGVILAMSRGRSSHFALLQQCRRILAFGLACGLHITWRWIPSELNPADAGSREPTASLSRLQFASGEWHTTGEAPSTLEELCGARNDEPPGGFSSIEGIDPCLATDLSWLPPGTAVEDSPSRQHPQGPQEVQDEHAASARRCSTSSCSHHSSSVELPCDARRVLSLFDLLGCDEGSAASGDGRGFGRGLLGLGGHDVHGRPPGLFGGEVIREPPGLVARPQCAWIGPPPGILSLPTILEATCSWPLEVAAYTLAADAHCGLVPEAAAPGDGLVAGGVFHDVLPAIRGVQPQSGRPSPAHAPASSSRASAPPLRDAGGVEGSTVRRRRPARQRDLPVAAQGNGENAEVESKSSHRQDVRLPVQGTPVSLSPGVRGAQGPRPKPVSAKARGSVSRRGDKDEDITRDQTSGKVGKRHLSPAVRKADLAPGGGSKGITDTAVPCHRDREKLGRALQRLDERLIARGLRSKFFIEVFSGSGRLSLALVGQDVRCITFDILDGPQGDLLQADVRRHLYRLIRHRGCLGVWFGFPCGTFSRARRGSAGMPGALRGEEGKELYGLPGLSEKDQLKVDVANKLLRHLAAFCRYCHRRRVPFYIENPLTSRLWKTHELRGLAKLTHSVFVNFDFCQFGEPWRKSTQLLVSRHSDIRVIERKCKFGRGFVCSATGKRHIVLSGASGGVFWTARAQAYPHRLCRAIATTIREHALFRWTGGGG